MRPSGHSPGSRDEFRRLYVEQSWPVLKHSNFDVLAHGPSLHDENTYYMIRHFDSFAQREQMEDAYYASDDRTTYPCQAILAWMETTAISYFSWIMSGCKVTD